MSDNSFTFQTVDVDANGNYNHPTPKPGEELWQKLNISVDPWMDEIFGDGSALVFADLTPVAAPHTYMHSSVHLKFMTKAITN